MNLERDRKIVSCDAIENEVEEDFSGDDSSDDYHYYLKNASIGHPEASLGRSDSYHDYLKESKYPKHARSRKRIQTKPKRNVEYRQVDQSSPSNPDQFAQDKDLHEYHDYLKATKYPSRHTSSLHDEFISWRDCFVQQLRDELEITHAMACSLVRAWTQEPYRQNSPRQISAIEEKEDLLLANSPQTSVVLNQWEASPESEKSHIVEDMPKARFDLQEKTAPVISLAKTCADTVAVAGLSQNDSQGVFAIGAACVAAIAAISVATVKLLAVDIPKKNLEIEQARIAALEIRTNVRKLEHEMRKEENGIAEAQKELAADRKALENDQKDLKEQTRVLEYQQKALDRDRQPWKEAEWYQRSAMKRLRDEYGDNHITSLLASECLAMAYCFQGRLGEAEHMQTKVITTIEETLGSGHPRMASSVDALLTILRRKGNNAGAAAVERRWLTQSPESQPAHGRASFDSAVFQKESSKSPRDSCRSLDISPKTSRQEFASSSNGISPQNLVVQDENDDSSNLLHDKKSLQDHAVSPSPQQDFSALRDSIAQNLRNLPVQLNELGAKRWADKINQTVLRDRDEVDEQVAALCEEVKTIFVESSAKWGQWVVYTESLKSRATSVASL